MQENLRKVPTLFGERLNIQPIQLTHFSYKKLGPSVISFMQKNPLFVLPPSTVKPLRCCPHLSSNLLLYYFNIIFLVSLWSPRNGLLLSFLCLSISSVSSRALVICVKTTIRTSFIMKATRVLLYIMVCYKEILEKFWTDSHTHVQSAF